MNDSGFHKIKIEPNYQCGSLSHRITLDGIVLKGIQNIEIALGYNSIPTIKFDIISDNIIIGEEEK